MCCMYLDVQKNLVLGLLLNKNKFRLVFEANKFVLTKNGMLGGNDFISDRLFKLNVMTITHKIVNEIKASSLSVYMLVSSD